MNYLQIRFAPFIRDVCFIGALSLATFGRAQSLTISTVAGQLGVYDDVDGTVATAHFGNIAGIVKDSAANIYVSDSQSIRKITPNGLVTTWAGAAGIAGSVDGVGAAARFNQPRAMVIDPADNIYVCDNGAIRKITPTAVVTTLAGVSGYRQIADGEGSDARFLGPDGLVLDSAGNLYASDGSAVRRITPSGVVTTIAGQEFAQGMSDGIGSQASFNNAVAIALDLNGNLYVCDSPLQTIRKITPAGMVSTLAGSPHVAGSIDGTGAAARFNYPSGIAFDGRGGLYVADINNHKVRRVSLTGVVTTVAGGLLSPGYLLFPDGVGYGVVFGGPEGLYVDSDAALFIADGTRLRKGINAPVVAQVAAQPIDQIVPSGQDAQFSVTANGNPAVGYQWQSRSSSAASWVNLADGGRYAGSTNALLTVSAVDFGISGNQVRCIVSNVLGNDVSAPAQLSVDPPVIVVPLRVTTLAGSYPGNAGGTDGRGPAARFAGPMAVTVDPAGNVYVADSFGNRIRKITPDGLVTTVAGSGMMGSADGIGRAAQFGEPSGIARDSSGILYIADGWNSTIRKIALDGTVSTYAGSSGVRGTTDGPRTAARFSTPVGLVFDPSGNLIVADRENDTIRQITPQGIVSTVAGSGGLSGNTDGLAAFARFYRPSGVASDPNGNIFVADSANNTIRKIAPGGLVTTVAGSSGQVGSADGRAALARFHYPVGIAVGAGGSIFVSDFGNNTIREINAAGTVSTLAGVAPSLANSNTAGYTDGIGSLAQFNEPAGLALDQAGNLYVADALSNTIRKAFSVAAVASGDPITLSVQTDGSNDVSGYQWMRDSQAIAGATGPNLAVPAAQPSDAGSYSVAVITPGGIAVSQPVVVTVLRGRLVNLSAIAVAGAGAQSLTVGFVVSGQGLPLLIRGIGPTLTKYGVATPLPDPQLTLFSGSSAFAFNAGWANSPDIAATADRVGAFALPAAAIDASLMTTLDGGPYTVQCTPVDNANGPALVELYDSGTSAASHLINLSASSQIGPNSTLSGGFVIQGTAPFTVLIRGIGPTLATFGVAGALSDPLLQLFDSNSNLIAQNDNWSDAANASDVVAAAQTVSAFPLATGSRDASILITLQPGRYSAKLSGVAAGSGVGMVEIYAVR